MPTTGAEPAMSAGVPGHRHGFASAVSAAAGHSGDGKFQGRRADRPAPLDSCKLPSYATRGDEFPAAFLDRPVLKTRNWGASVNVCWPILCVSCNRASYWPTIRPGQAQGIASGPSGLQPEHPMVLLGIRAIVGRWIRSFPPFPQTFLRRITQGFSGMVTAPFSGVRKWTVCRPTTVWHHKRRDTSAGPRNWKPLPAPSPARDRAKLRKKMLLPGWLPCPGTTPIRRVYWNVLSGPRPGLQELGSGAYIWNRTARPCTRLFANAWRAKTVTGVRAASVRAGISSDMCRARMAVIYGGYNSLTDVMARNLPTLVLLRGMRDKEQERHMELLSGKLSFLRAVDAATATTESFLQVMEDVSQSQGGALNAGGGVDLDGAATTAHILARDIGDTSRGRRIKMAGKQPWSVGPKRFPG